MVTLATVEEQLQKIGSNFRFWGRPEIRELTNILMQNEQIAGCVNGRYEGGFALLCVTNYRLLLIDRKPLFLSLEDVRFDMISEMDYSARLLDNTVYIITPSRKLSFNTWSQKRLRAIMNYTQQRVMEVRQHYLMQQFQPAPQAPQADYAAPLVGNLAAQGAAPSPPVTIPAAPINPYATPLLMRRRRYPRFY